MVTNQVNAIGSIVINTNSIRLKKKSNTIKTAIKEYPNKVLKLFLNPFKRFHSLLFGQ